MNDTFLSDLSIGYLDAYEPEMLEGALLELDPEKRDSVMGAFVLDASFFAGDPELDPELFLDASYDLLRIADERVLAEHEDPPPDLVRIGVEDEVNEDEDDVDEDFEGRHVWLFER